MTPNVFESIKGLPILTTGQVTRFFPFSMAPQNVATPYATWQASATPDRYVTCVPDADMWTVQVDCFDTTASSVRDVARAIRDALEAKWACALMEDFGRDIDTGLYRYILRFEGRQSR